MLQVSGFYCNYRLPGVGSCLVGSFYYMGLIIWIGLCRVLYEALRNSLLGAEYTQETCVACSYLILPTCFYRDYTGILHQGRSSKGLNES